MKVYKVMIENNAAISAIPADGLKHGDIGFKEDKETVEWLTLECTDEKTAMEIADKVVKMIWGGMLLYDERKKSEASPIRERLF